MTLLPELDDLELDMVLAGDQVSFATRYGGLYSPQGDLIVAGVHEVTDEAYRAAWARVEAWSTAPENRRGNLFSRDGEDFLVVTRYVGLDMALAVSPAPHVPQIWETQILTQTDLLHQWRYHTLTAAHAGHATILERLAGFPAVTKIK